MKPSASQTEIIRGLSRIVPFRPAAIIGPFLLVILMAGCVNFPVMVQDDPFMRKTAVSVDMWHTVIDGDFDNIRALYRKEISGGRVSEPVATIVFVATVGPYHNDYHGESLEREAYILVDSDLFPIQLTESTNNRYKRDAVIYDSFYWGYGYYPFFYYNPGVTIVRRRDSHVLTGKFHLTPEMQQAIAGAASYKIRLYAGKNPVTLEATPRQLDALKQFIEYGRPAVPEQGI